MIDKAIIFLKEHGIEAFENAGILVVPVSTPEEIYEKVSVIKNLLKEVGYEKSWQIDPYYYQRKRHENGQVVVGPED